ncbi:MAG: chemosensory pili system protein ChpC [Lysobacterales bacterium]|jgi:chemosensory pili system protein ChpC
MPEEIAEIRTLLAPVTDGTIMLPGSVIAEVVDLPDPQPYTDAPDWLLGGMNWNEWHVPILSLSILAGVTAKEMTNARSRVLIVKSLSESSGAPYLGLLISGVPRLAKVGSDSLNNAIKPPKSQGLFSEVTFNDEQVWIPDLDEIVRLVEPQLEKN